MATSSQLPPPVRLLPDTPAQRRRRNKVPKGQTTCRRKIRNIIPRFEASKALPVEASGSQLSPLPSQPINLSRHMLPATLFLCAPRRLLHSTRLEPSCIAQASAFLASAVFLSISSRSSVMLSLAWASSALRCAVLSADWQSSDQPRQLEPKVMGLLQ